MWMQKKVKTCTNIKKYWINTNMFWEHTNALAMYMIIVIYHTIMWKEHIRQIWRSIEIPIISLMLFSLLFTQPSNHSVFEGITMGSTFLLCVAPAIAPYIKYINIRVENFHLIMQIYSKAMLYNLFS